MKVDILIKALEWYAKGGDTSNDPNTINEFGCGCCACTINDAGDINYQGPIQGTTAREALRTYKLAVAIEELEADHTELLKKLED